jgi:hypothetical protein
MKKWVNNTVLFALLLTFALIPAGCGEGEADGDSFDMKLHGTWKTHNPDSSDPCSYAGGLVIDWRKKTIVITGYGKIPYYCDPDDAERPFKDFDKDTPLRGYSKDGNIYIYDFEWKEGIAYKYDRGTYDSPERLRFNFGGRDETLWKIEE